MRQLYGRNGPGKEPIEFATFSVDEEYQKNELERSLGLAEEIKPVRAVAPGRHQLQSLLNGELHKSFLPPKQPSNDCAEQLLNRNVVLWRRVFLGASQTRRSRGQGMVGDGCYWDELSVVCRECNNLNISYCTNMLDAIIQYALLNIVKCLCLLFLSASNPNLHSWQYKSLFTATRPPPYIYPSVHFTYVHTAV
jgi:hypothetical protein